MRNGIIDKSDGDTLLEIYKVFDLDGNQKRPLTAKEMVLIFSIGKLIQEGKIATLIGADWRKLNEYTTEYHIQCLEEH